MEEISRALEQKKNRELVREICKREPTLSRNLFVILSENRKKIVFSLLYIEYAGPRYQTSKIFKKDGGKWYLVTRSGKKHLKKVNFDKERDKLLKKTSKLFVIEGGKAKSWEEVFKGL